MTQMMLFDTQTSFTGAEFAGSKFTGPEFTGPEFAGGAVAAPVATAATITEPPASETSSPTESYDRGVNHMGDLARLVLLRYDLVAARRARNAQRRSAETRRHTAK